MAAEGVEKRLKAAENAAAKERTIDLHLADSGRPLNLSCGRRADETDLDQLYR